MDENEFEQSREEFQVEIKDLDKPDAAGDRSLPSPGARKPRLSLHRRRFSLILLNSLLILTVILILGNTTPVRNLVSSAISRTTPSPTPTLVPGVDLFYIRISPLWGRLTIDGRPTPLPAINVNPPLRLARGQHLLVWQAPPFLTQRCSVSVPNNYATDTCHYNETAGFGTETAWVITFSETLATLPADQRNALLQTTQDTLDTLQSTDTVRPGEHYTLASNDPACRNTRQNQCSAIATQPLKATLSFRLDANDASNEACIDPQQAPCTLFSQNCHLFCAGSLATTVPVQEWDAFAPIKSLWTFATMNGQVLARDVPDNSSWDYATGQTLDESLIPLRITWNSQGWHVVVPADLSGQDSGYSGYFDPACAAAVEKLRFLNPPADANGGAVDLQWQFASGPVPASGCLAVGTPLLNGLFTPTPTHAPQPVIFCLHRFGVLLLVNSSLPSANWSLPLADSYEQQLARQLRLRLPKS